jgi:hypothetical protein
LNQKQFSFLLDSTRLMFLLKFWMNWIWLNGIILNSIDYKLVEFNSNWIHSNQFWIQPNYEKVHFFFFKCIIYSCKWVDEKSDIVEIVMECFPNCEMNKIQIVKASSNIRRSTINLTFKMSDELLINFSVKTFIA